MASLYEKDRLGADRQRHGPCAMTSILSLRAPAARFLLTGIMMNATLFVVLWALLHLGVPYKLAITAVFVAGMVWGYLQNRIWSWRSTVPVTRSAVRYLGVYGSIYLLHFGAVSLLVDVAGWRPLLAAMMSVAALVAPLFYVLDRLVFRGGRL